MAETTQSKYYPAFDYLRIVLAGVVALTHSGISAWREDGNYAVQVFFAMSGWLIGGILLRSKPSELPKFYFHRAARIWIPYYTTIILLIIASLMKEVITAKWLEFFFYDVTFVYNFFGPPQLAASRSAMPLQGTGNHLWSICSEEQFYLIAPLIIAVLGTIGRTILFWGIVTISILASPLWMFFGAVSLGVLASTAKLRFGDWQTSATSRIILLILWLAFFSATYWDAIPYRIGAPISAICIILFFAQPGNHSPVATFLGGVSYPMYLNHWIGVFIANYIFAKFSMRGSLAAELSSVVIGFVVSAILYLVIDSNVRRYRDRYFTEFRGFAVAVCGFALVAIGLIGGFRMMVAQ